MLGKIDSILSAHAITVMARREKLENPLVREFEDIAPSAIVSFAAG